MGILLQGGLFLLPRYTNDLHDAICETYKLAYLRLLLT
jgi:hypothetical protein